VAARPNRTGSRSPSRRDFLSRIITVAGALSLGATAVCTAEPASSASKSSRVLILGGTGHIGPFFVRAALARGHEVSVFSRGREHVELPSTVERLVGDRNGNLDSIRHRDWDAVLDLATYGPGWVRSLGAALKGRVGHYTFISTISVYDNPAANGTTRESSRVLVYQGSRDPYSITDEGPDYGALKVLCEQEAERQFPGETLVLRSGYIVLPDDLGHNGFIAYWPVRARQGGTMLVAGNPATPVQYIDIRDMAEWAIRMVEKRATGVYNTVGPTAPTSLAELVNAARALASKPPAVTWVPVAWLSGQKDRDIWGQLVFWYYQGLGGLTQINIDRAVAAGFTSRTLSATLAQVLRWYDEEPRDERAVFVAGHRKQPDGLWVPVRASWPDYLGHERTALARWHAQHVGTKA
jgi:2'-hydroxyisoflavone reductase